MEEFCYEIILLSVNEDIVSHFIDIDPNNNYFNSISNFGSLPTKVIGFVRGQIVR